MWRCGRGWGLQGTNAQGLDCDVAQARGCCCAPLKEARGVDDGDGVTVSPEIPGLDGDMHGMGDLGLDDVPWRMGRGLVVRCQGWRAWVLAAGCVGRR